MSRPASPPTLSFRIVLDTVAPLPALAAEAAARALDVPAAELAARIAAGPGPLATVDGIDRARRAVAILALFGLHLRIAPAQAATRPPERREDLALQPTGEVPLPVLSLWLARRLGDPPGLTPAAILAGLRGPAGLILEALPQGQAAEMRRRCAGMQGLRLRGADTAASVYDLLNDPARPRADRGALCRHLSRLGLGPCALTGALATGLDAAMKAHVMARFPAAGIVAVNRAFQRFDLVMAEPQGDLPREVADFLLIRGAARPDGRGLIALETGLCRGDALAFQADYASIGVGTRLRPTSPGGA